MLLVTEVLADRGFVRTDSRHEIAPRPEMLPRAIALLAPLRAGTGNRTLPLRYPTRAATADVGGRLNSRWT